MRTRASVLLVLIPAVIVGAVAAPALVGVEPQTPVVAAAPIPTTTTAEPSQALGRWKVVWDRSDTGWRPALFHGTLLIEPDDVLLRFTESSAKPVVDEVDLDGPRVRLHLRWGDRGATQIVGVIEGDELLGYMRSDDTVSRKGVPWAPFTGTRAHDEVPPRYAPLVFLHAR